MIFKLGEMFCGPGGLAVGAMHASAVAANGEKFSIVHSWANDKDQMTCETYRRNICPDDPNSVIKDDARKIIDRIPSDFDAFAFGFPCNDFSLIGKRKGFNGEYGPLYRAGLEVLEKYKPKWFLAENVTGLVSGSQKANFHQILNDLYYAGYNIYPHMYEFEKYKVPQRRHRIIIVGINRELYPDLTFNIPAPTSPDPSQYVSCADALADIPEDAPNNEKPRHTERIIKRLQATKPGENAFSADLPQELALHVKRATLSVIYRRLKPDDPSYTVLGSGGGGTYMYHWQEPRALTNRERARLQTFPDDFVFCGSSEDIRKQIGMAVPCKGALCIFEAVLKTFAGVKYPAVDQNIPFKPDLPDADL